MMRALQNAAAGEQAAEQDGNDDTAQRILPRKKGNKDACITVTRIERFIRAALHGGNLHHAREAWSHAREKARDERDFSHRQTRELRRADVAANGANFKTERRLLN